MRPVGAHPFFVVWRGMEAACLCFPEAGNVGCFLRENGSFPMGKRSFPYKETGVSTHRERLFPARGTRVSVYWIQAFPVRDTDVRP